MTKHRALAAALLHAISLGCGDDQDAFDGPCPEMRGAWLYRYVERRSGGCDVGTVESLNVFGSNDGALADECTGEKLVSADGCEVTVNKVSCPAGDGTLTMDGVLRFTSPDRIEGVVNMLFDVPEDGLFCSSVFDLTATRQ